MAKKFLIVDLANLFYRARFATRGDAWTSLGLSLHITLNSFKAVAQKFDADHIVICSEGRSWRKQYDENYKRNRSVAREKLTESEQETDKLFMDTFRDFENFLDTQTNCTTLRHESLEADDCVAAWIQLHPDDKHIILSSDTDFQQLIAENVHIYDGIGKKHYTLDGVYDERDKKIVNKKTKQPEIVFPEYSLFKKIIRGDTSDNVFSAYPGVRETKILEAFQDREKKGYNFNNFMMSRWTDHNQVEHQVRDKFEHNRVLIDLTAQPELIRKCMEETVLNAYKASKAHKNIGFNLLKFCGKYELKSLAENSKAIVDILNKKLVE